MPMTGFTTSARPVIGFPRSPRRRTNRGSADRTLGSAVAPGTPLSRAQQEARRDSLMNTTGLDGQSEPKALTIGESFAELARKMRLDSQQLDIFTPEAILDTSTDDLQVWRPGKLRMLIVAAISVLIVFGSAYQLLEYLLFVTRVSASCIPSTVYIPVTRYASVSGSAPAIGNSTAQRTIYSTATELATMTSYVTLQPSVVATGLTSDGVPSYYFTVNSAGSTDWLNGVSPPATASLTVITRSIFVTPVMPSASYSTTTATITSTATVQQTITVPAYTSTTYSFVVPDATVTSTSTHYVTYTVSRVGSIASGAGTPTARTSYSGPGMSGWNTSSVRAPDPTGLVNAADAEPQLTTFTEVHYWGEGDMTTSTMTSYITTSIQVAYTTVVTPAMPGPNDSPDLVTTITALPVTITYSGDEGYSTSIALNAPAVSPVGSSSTVGTSGPYQTGSSIASPLMSSGISAIPATQGSSPGVFTNSTMGPITMSASGYSPAVGPASNSSQTATTTSGAVAPSLSGNQSSSSPPSSSAISTVPGPVSPSTSLNKTLATSVTGRSASSPSASASAGHLSASTVAASGTPSSVQGSSSLPVGINATAGTLSVTTASGGTSSPTQSSTSLGPLFSSRPAYGPYTVQTLSSVGSTVDPVSASLDPYSSASSATLSPVSSSLASSSSPRSAQTMSTSTRSSSSSVVTAVPVSPATSPNATSPSNLSQSLGSSASSSTPISLSSYFQTSASTTSSITGIPVSAASSMPTTGCGETGDFMLNFDNLPNFDPNNQDQTDITQAPPILNPYHHFTFSDGYVYAPDPKVPYKPISQPHLAVFVSNGTGMRATQAKNAIEEGEFADGPYEASSAFWFDAFSGWFGCDNEGPEVCSLVMSAYTYSQKEGDEVLSAKQNATVEGCPGFKDCKLKKIEFPDTFRSLSGLQVQAFVGQEERMFFMDDVNMRWTDNSCEAGLARQRAR